MPNTFRTRLAAGARFLLAGLLWTLSGAVLLAADAPPRPRQVFAHYMGCWPLASGPLQHERRVTQPEQLRHTRKGVWGAGGHVRNFDLAPPDLTLTPQESADLEIRRALRIGIDGFAVDAWAGDKVARQTLEALFAAAEAKKYPFQLTICLDPMCGGDIVASVKELLAKHGQSPNLARRAGKPLIFGYQSWCYGAGAVWAKTDAGLPKEERKAQVDRLRTEPEGWEAMGAAFDRAAEKIGEPIYWHYCLSSFFFNIDGALLKERRPSLAAAAGTIAKHAGAVGGFGWLGKEQDAVAAAVLAAGAEWSAPVGIYQKENVPYECYAPAGTEWLGGWNYARTSNATLLQLITWNDYGENTNIAPAYNTRYGLYDLTRYYLAWWKNGQEPAPDHDRVYLNYHKYPKGAKVWPFQAIFGPRDYALEIVTILPRPATLRLPGRQAEYEAPAGFHRQQFPLTPGPVVAELWRDGQLALRLESPEPIAAHPFREDNGLVCFSSEDERLWKEDFGDTPPFWYSEYGDSDGDGLPNWYEMYFFGKWLDFRTATGARPDADPDHDGKNNLQEYRERSDPTLAPPPAMPGLGEDKPPQAAKVLDELEER